MKLILWGAIAAQLLGNGVVLAQKTTPSTKAGIALAVLAGSNSPLQISGGDGALFTSDRGTVLEFHMMLSKPLSDQFSLITGACFGYANIHLNSTFVADILSPELDNAAVLVEFQGMYNIYVGLPLLLSYQHSLSDKLSATYRGGVRSNVRLGSKNLNDTNIPYLNENPSGDLAFAELGEITWNQVQSRFAYAYVLNAALQYGLRSGHYLSFGVNLHRSFTTISKGDYELRNVRELKAGTFDFNLNYWAINLAYGF